MTDGRNHLMKCQSWGDILANAGKRAIVAGIYKQVDIRMRKKAQPRYVGHTAIELADGTDVLLEPSWSPAAIRSADERAQFDGKRIEVIGIIHSQAPKPEEQIAYITGPCVSPVEHIQLAQNE